MLLESVLFSLYGAFMVECFHQRILWIQYFILEYTPLILKLYELSITIPISPVHIL